MKIFRATILLLVLSSAVYAGDIPNAITGTPAPTQPTTVTPPEVETMIETVLNLLPGVLPII